MLTVSTTVETLGCQNKWKNYFPVFRHSLRMSSHCASIWSVPLYPQFILSLIMPQHIASQWDICKYIFLTRTSTYSFCKSLYFLYSTISTITVTGRCPRFCPNAPMLCTSSRWGPISYIYFGGIMGQNINWELNGTTLKMGRNGRGVMKGGAMGTNSVSPHQGEHKIKIHGKKLDDTN